VRGRRHEAGHDADPGLRAGTLCSTLDGGLRRWRSSPDGPIGLLSSGPDSAVPRIQYAVRLHAAKDSRPATGHSGTTISQLTFRGQRGRSP